MKTIFSLLILVGLAAAAGYYYVKYYHSETAASFRTAAVERGNMMPTIEATGSLEPEQVVDIGSQVNGLIVELKADYGSLVEAHQVLATIDKTLYQATFDQADAAVNSARANLLLGQANLALAESNLKRDATLLQTKGAIAPNQYDTDFAACEVAKATVKVDEAAVKQTEATRKQAEVNLGYCNIQSPVKGTIVDRRVNVGQTVVSSLSASSLFLLAKDLTKIQVWASVNEADIGRIHQGLKVRFKVDAYPNDTFVGTVAQIRLNATMTQNVVTYTVVVVTDNKEMKLLPYMTASLNFEIERHEDILKVPNAALRWKPRPKQIAPDVREETLKAMSGSKQSDDGKEDAGGKSATGGAKGVAGTAQSAAVSEPKGGELAASSGTATGLKAADWKARSDKIPAADKIASKDVKAAEPAKSQAAQPAAAREPPGRLITPQEAKANKERHESGRLWVVDGEFVRPFPVKIIATDGTMTEVRGKNLSENMEVVVGESVASDADNDTTNPFMPKMFRGGANRPKNSGASKDK